MGPVCRMTYVARARMNLAAIKRVPPYLVELAVQDRKLQDCLTLKGAEICEEQTMTVIICAPLALEPLFGPDMTPSVVIQGMHNAVGCPCRWCQAGLLPARV